MTLPPDLPADALLAAIIHSSDDAIISKNLNGIVTSWNRGAEALFGYSTEEMVGRPIAVIAAPGREGEMPLILERIRRGERIDHYETQRRHKDGTVLDISLTVSPIFGASGNVIGASKIARDISERKRRDERLQLLVGELNHRSKNLLSVAQAIVRLTNRDTVEQFKEVVEGRLTALGHVHRKIAEHAWEGADLSDIAIGGLAPFHGDGNELICSGPPLLFMPKAAQAIAMMFHELATNAAKYGAWSRPGGNVRISWTSVEDRVVLEWLERGGPPAAAPPQSHFGVLLIEQEARHLGGKAQLAWEPEGLRCTIAIHRENTVDIGATA